MSALTLLLEDKLAIVAGFLKLSLEAIAICCILIGLIKTAQLGLAMYFRPRPSPHRPLSQKVALVLLRLRFGVWMAIALEFQLGADIVGTTVAPTFAELGKLGAVAAVRTVLNYFLNKELVEEFKVQRKVEKMLMSKK